MATEVYYTTNSALFGASAGEREPLPSGMWAVLALLILFANSIQDYQNRGIGPLLQAISERGLAVSDAIIAEMGGANGLIAQMQKALKDGGDDMSSKIGVLSSKFNLANTRYGKSSSFAQGLSDGAKQILSALVESLSMLLKTAVEGPVMQIGKVMG